MQPARLVPIGFTYGTTVDSADEASENAMHGHHLGYD
jgi:hypothetical protein